MGLLMERRNFVEFDADFPDDAVWDEDGNNLVPGGQAIAEYLRNQLRERGLPTSKLVQHHFYGWAFEISSEEVDVWCLLQGGGDWLLIVDPRLSLIERLVGSSRLSGFDKVRSILHDILSNDSHFAKVMWYTRRDYESGRSDRGQPSP